MTLNAILRSALLLPVSIALAHANTANAKSLAVSQANLTQSLAAAQPGDVLVLAAGGYGTIVMPKKTWQVPITVDARSASLTGIAMLHVSGVNWIGGEIIGTGYGVSINDSSNITISGASITAAVRGIVINKSADIKILRNKLHGIRTDGIDIVGSRILVEGNTITNMLPIGGDHPDGVQVWSATGNPSRDITIRGNTITGDMQGIFARANGIGVTSLTVTGNKITVSFPIGIVLLDTTYSVATGNTVRSLPGSKYKANMHGIGEGNIVCGNVVPDVPRAPAVKPCGG